MANRGRPKGSGKKATSKPWEGGENPWTPDIFRLPEKHAGFNPCFVSKKDVEDYLSKGYVFAIPEDYGIIKSEESEKGVANRIYRKEMVLLEVSDAQKKMRDDYFRELTDRRLGDALTSDTDTASREAHGGITTELKHTLS